MSSDDDTGGYRIIRPTSKGSFEEVRLYEETLSGHIPDNHPELRLVGTLLGSKLLGAAIEEVIANPTRLHQSVSSTTSEVFASTLVTSGGNQLIVPVRSVAGTASGRVVTAYFSDNDYPGTLIWSADDE
jgi:hypothetical protein